MAICLPNNLADIYNIRGNLYSYLGNYEKAVANYNKYLELSSNSNAYYNLGITQYFLNMLDEATNNLECCIQSDLDNKFAYYHLAVINYALNQKEKVSQYFDTATRLEKLEDNPLYAEDEHGYYARGLAKYQIGNNIEGAFKDIKKAKEIATKHQYIEFVEKAGSLLSEIEAKK